MRLTVTKPFQVTISKAEGPILAQKGDILTIKERGTDYYYLSKLNGEKIYLTWQRKEWVADHTLELQFDEELS